MRTKGELFKYKKTMLNNKPKYIHSITQDFISFAPNLYLKLGKMHEICGPAKIRIAMLIGAKTKGLIVWVDFIINTDSISDWFSPSRLLFVNAKSKNDLFSATEEVLRSGLSEITITELPEAPNSLQMRHINLAMTSGVKLNNNKSPLGLILSPNKGGATSIESRWYASTLPCWEKLTTDDRGSSKQKWSIKRLFSRVGPVKGWSIETTIDYDRNMSPKLLSLSII
jgi:protein ImuA